MKKTSLIALTAIAAAAFSMSAAADVTLTKVTQITGVDGFVDGTNLLFVGDYNSHYAIATIDGEILTNQSYKSYAYTRDGYFDIADLTVPAPHNTALFSASGVNVIPAAYGKIDVENEHWAIAYTFTESDANQYDEEDYSNNKYYLYNTADVYFLDGDTATKVVSLERANIKDYYAEGIYINIENRSSGKISTYDSTGNVVANPDSTYRFNGLVTSDYYTFKENGQEGIKDKDGNVVFAPAYKYIYDIIGSYAKVSTGDKYGLADINGNVLVPAEYDDINRSYNVPSTAENDYRSSAYVAAGYVCVEKDGKLGFVDVNGNVTAVPTYSENIFDVNGASATYTDMANDFHVLAADGVDTVLAGDMAEARDVSYASGLLYKYHDSNYNYGLVDWHGNELFPAQYDGFEVSGDGTYLLVFTANGVADLYTIDYGTVAAPAEAAPEEAAPAADGSSAKALLQSAAALAQADAGSNAAAILALVQQAASALDSSSPVATILSTAQTMLQAGSTDTIASLLTSAVTLLG